jgi:hypothetical protein
MARTGDRENVEIVPYGAYESSIPSSSTTVRIQVQRPRRGRRKESL